MDTKTLEGLTMQEADVYRALMAGSKGAVAITLKPPQVTTALISFERLADRRLDAIAAGDDSAPPDLNAPATLADVRAILRKEICETVVDELGLDSRQLLHLAQAYVALGGNLELTEPEPPASDQLLEPVATLVAVLGRFHGDDFPGRLEDLVEPINNLARAYLDVTGQPTEVTG